MSSGSGWIGVDLDGTLAHYDGWKGVEHIGAPIPAMVERVKRWLAEGREVRIFTARVGTPSPDRDRMSHDEWMAAMDQLTAEILAVRTAIDAWCLEHLGVVLPITNVKDFGMIELWDDRAVQVEANTGKPYGPSTRDLDAVPARPIVIRYSIDGRLYYVENFEFHRPRNWLGVEKGDDGKYIAYPDAFYEIRSGKEVTVDADHKLVKRYAECEGWPTFGSPAWCEAAIRQMEHHRKQRVEAQRTDSIHRDQFARLHALFLTAFTNDTNAAAVPE